MAAGRAPLYRPALLRSARAQGKPPEGGLDRGEDDEGIKGFRDVLEILLQAADCAGARKSLLDHSAARQHEEPFTSSLRLTIARRSRGTLATAAPTCHAL